MNRQIDATENPETRSISRPTLILAIVLTVAWFSMLAIAIASTGNAETASAYGIDEFQTKTVVASR